MTSNSAHTSDRRKSKFKSDSQPSVTSTEQSENCFTCTLPDELIADIISERLLQDDCKLGAVFDGLESTYTPTQPTVLLNILKGADINPLIH